MHKATLCAKVLVPYFHAFCEQDWEKAKALFEKAKELEHQADDIKQKVRFNLYHNNLMLILSKSDIISLIVSQDQIANKARDVMGNMLGRRFTLPDENAKLLLKSLVEKTVEAAVAADTITKHLSDFLETSWSDREKESMYKKLAALDKLESQSDQLQRDLRQALYKIEDQLKPVDAMFLYSNIRTLGTLANTAQNIGHRLLLLIAQ